jgi:hypothetical protein
MSVKPEWVRAVAAAAIDPTRLDAMQLYDLYAKLVRDNEVVRLRQNGTLSADAAIRQMTRYQRIDLKERVSGVIAFKRKEESHATS